MVKLAEDRFTLAVLGLFKRGKSSLMSAIIGRELLPTGVLPLTSVITVLKFGPEEKLRIERDGNALPAEAPISRLAEYATEEENPGNRKKVKTVQVEIPLAFLRQGLEFVDTPGIGSAIEANTATTYAFLPQCDAVLFVTGADAPLSKAEIDFLDRVRAQVRKIFLVVNKMDLLGEFEQQQVLAFVATALEKHTGGEPFPICPVSSRLGLEAKKGRDPASYTRSGLKDLEESLAVYLAAEKSSTFLVATLDRALRLLARETGDERLAATVEHRSKALATALETLQRGLLVKKTSDPHQALPPVLLKVPQPPPPEEKSGTVEETDISSALRSRDCPVCHYLWRSAFDFFAKWQYALSVEQSTQEAFAAELGFCPLHTWQLVSIASPQGLSQGYPRLLDRIAAELSQAARTPETAPEILRALVLGLGDCHACRFLRQQEAVFVQCLAAFVAGVEGRRAYSRSQGVCLRHLALLMECAPTEGAAFLLSEAVRHVEAWAEDMRSFATKRDATRRALINRDEEGAYLRAIVHLVGDRTLSAPKEEEVEI